VGISIRASTSYDPATRLLTAELRGDPRALEGMKKTTTDWSYAIACCCRRSRARRRRERAGGGLPLVPHAGRRTVRLATKTTVFYSLKKRGG
jgi:hypothetical protein